MGRSGAGKSTLVRAVIDGKRLQHGKVLADGWDIHEYLDWFRKCIGYVPQQPVLHDHLTARQALSFAGNFRGCDTQGDWQQRVEDTLRAVDLPAGRWDAKLKSLSGGELRRVQTAAEIIHEPGLLILDEPTSGLDTDREREVIRLLHSLSRRGATVLVVTHSRNLQPFDRTIRLRPPGRLESDIASIASRDARPQAASREAVEAGRQSSWRSWLRQTRTLLMREAQVALGDWLWKLVLPLVVVPVLFAFSLHWAVPPVDLNTLGFLAVLSCIWMASSLSLLSIVNERRIVEHERQMFLDVAPYVSAKTLWLFAGAMIQCILFFDVLALLRRYQVAPADAMLFHAPWCLLCLVLVAWAAAGMGMLISAICRYSSLTANFVLPLVMMAQILFSVEIAAKGGGSAAEAYSAFSVTSDPQSVAAALSWLTISRQGDMTLRSFAYSKSAVLEDHCYFIRAIFWLGAWIVATPLLTGLWIYGWHQDYES